LAFFLRHHLHPFLFYSCHNLYIMNKIFTSVIIWRFLALFRVTDFSDRKKRQNYFSIVTSLAIFFIMNFILYSSSCKDPAPIELLISCKYLSFFTDLESLQLGFSFTQCGICFIFLCATCLMALVILCFQNLLFPICLHL